MIYHHQRAVRKSARSPEPHHVGTNSNEALVCKTDQPSLLSLIHPSRFPDISSQSRTKTIPNPPGPQHRRLPLPSLTHTPLLSNHARLALAPQQSSGEITDPSRKRSRRLNTAFPSNNPPLRNSIVGFGERITVVVFGL